MADVRFIQRVHGQWRHAISLVRVRPFDPATADGRSKERYRRIALTSVSALAVRGVGTITGLITVPLVLGSLGKARFGLWSTITTVVMWVALFDFGIASGLLNCIARAHGRDDREEASRFVSSAFYSLVGIAGTLMALLAVTAGKVPWHDILAVRGAVDDRTVRWSVIAALAAFFVGMPLSIVPQIYAGYQRTYVFNACLLVGTVSGFVALLFALRWDLSMPVLIVVFGAGSLISCAIGLVYAVRFGLPWLRVSLSAVSFDALRGLMSRSAPLFLFQFAALAVNETQTIVLAHRCDLATVADYSIVMRLYLLLAGLIQVSTASFVPSFREARERGDHDWMRAGFRRFVQVRTVLATIAGVSMLLLGNVVLKVWLRRTDMVFSPAVWCALAVLMVSATWVTVHSEMLMIMDRLWVLVPLAFLNGVVTVALTYWLAPHLGVLGVILAAGAVTLLLYTWIVPMITRPIIRPVPRP